mmetsp:Transcript_23246/g.64936  ORF Transcript_23246/g.64936 Transcript_23246/m.64936 type:complete len:229 (-) Transcript_23246:119-805(-)
MAFAVKVQAHDGLNRQWRCKTSAGAEEGSHSQKVPAPRCEIPGKNARSLSPGALSPKRKAREDLWNGIAGDIRIGSVAEAFFERAGLWLCGVVTSVDAKSVKVVSLWKGQTIAKKVSRDSPKLRFTSLEQGEQPKMRNAATTRTEGCLPLYHEVGRFEVGSTVCVRSTSLGRTIKATVTSCRTDRVTLRYQIGMRFCVRIAASGSPNIWADDVAKVGGQNMSLTLPPA